MYYVYVKSINNTSEIKEALGDAETQGLNTPSQSPSAFSVADTVSSIRNFIAGYLKTATPEQTWSMTVVYNHSSNPKLDDETLKQVFESEVVSFKELTPSKQQEEEEEIATLFTKNKTEATYRLAQYIVQKYNIITVGEKEREMFIYKDGMYYPGAENLVIYPEIQRILNSQVNKNSKSETFHKIADATAHPRSIFQQTDPRYIPLRNGVYDFETNTLLPHSPDYRFTYQFPIVYAPEATCPKTDAFFDDILNPTQRRIVEGWIGYYFYRVYMFKKAMIFVGAGDTGKTTLLEVVTYLLGRDNISSISLQKMSGDKFSAAHLYEKHANLVDELSARDITDTGAFKMATGGGSVTGEYKFGNQFSFHNFSKFTFACNKIPEVKDMDDEAFFNRWLVIRFENTIEKKIPNFVDTLRTEDERSGLFNLAMIGLRRLLDQKRLSYFNSAEETKNLMMMSGSSIAMFSANMLTKEFGVEVTREEMYDAYTDYCQKNSLAPQTKEMLGRRLIGCASYISDGMVAMVSGKKHRVWRNAKLRVTEEKKVEQTQAEKDFADF